MDVSGWDNFRQEVVTASFVKQAIRTNGRFRLGQFSSSISNVAQNAPANLIGSKRASWFFMARAFRECPIVGTNRKRMRFVLTNERK